MSYKHHLTNHWAGCRLLAEAHDHCRKRPVKLFLIPGEFDWVGVSDGTDAWVAPANVHSIFGVDVKPLLRGIRAGHDVAPVKNLARARVRVQVTEEAAVIQEPTTPSRSRVRVAVQA